MRVYASAEMTLTDTNDGISVTGIDRYYMASSYSSGITVDSSGWKTEPQETNPLSRYHWSYEVVNYSSGPPVPSKPAIIGVYGKDGVAGKDSIVGYLTNENVTFPATSTGAVSSGNLALANGTFKVFDGLTEKTGSGVTYSVATQTGATGAITTAGIYSVSAITADNASIVFRAVYGGVSIDKILTLSKSKAGLNGYTPIKGTDYFDGKDGTNGSSSYLWIMYSQNANGNPMVDSPTNAKYIGVATTTTNTKPTSYSAYKWSLVKGTDGINGEKGANGQTSYLHIKYSNDGGATFTANNGETVGEWIGTYVDFTEADSTLVSKYTWNKVKGDTGDKGSDGISPIVGFLTNESITLPASSTGVVSSFTGATGTLNVYEGTALINAQADYSVVSQSSITVSITQSGVYTVSAMTSGASVLSGTATLRAVYNGVTIDKILTVTKALAGTQGGKGETGSTGATGSAGQNATSYWINASVNAIKKDVAGTIVPNTITFSGFSKTGTANPVAYAGRFIIQTSTNGTSYADAYKSSANQSSYTYTIPSTASFVKAKYYLAGGTTVLLDEQTVPVLVDAEGIEIGGRNYVLNSGEERTGNHGYGITDLVISDPYALEGSPVIVSFEAKHDEGNRSIPLHVYYRHRDGRNLGFSYGKNQHTTTEYERFEIPMDSDKMPSDMDEWINLAIRNGDPSDRWSIKNIKLEKGNKATDWTEAPEDVDEKIGNKADLDYAVGIEESLNDLNVVVGELGIDKIKQQLSEYQEFLSNVESKSLESEARLKELLSDDGVISLITTNLENFSQRWNTLEGFIQISGDETDLTISKGSASMVINSDSLTFFSGGSEVATITGQYMKIDKTILVSGMHIGRHMWMPLSSDRDYLSLKYIGEASV